MHGPSTGMPEPLDSSAFEQDAPGLEQTLRKRRRVCYPESPRLHALGGSQPCQTLERLEKVKCSGSLEWHITRDVAGNPENGGLPSKPGPACKMSEKPQDVAKKHAA